MATPKGLTDTIAFVLCTIQQPFAYTDRQMADIRANGAASKYLFGAKRTGYQYALDHAAELHAAILEASKSGDTVAAIDALSAIPGLGIVKAAFVAQICGFDVACLDMHNLRRLGYSETAFKFPKGLKRETRLAKIARYVELCRATGGARHWWNSWCDFVAGNRANKALATGDAVSAFHPHCLGLT